MFPGKEPTRDTIRLLYEDELPHRAIAVYMYLLDRYNRNTGQCFPSISTIATDLKISKATVFRALTELEHAGYIQRMPRSRKNGGRSSNQYVFLK